MSDWKTKNNDWRDITEEELDEDEVYESYYDEDEESDEDQER